VLGLADAIGDVALDGEGLKVARGLLEDEGGVPAADRHGNQRGHRRVIERGKPGAFLGHLPGAVFHQIGGGLGLVETDSEHAILLLSVSEQLTKLDSTTKCVIVKRRDRK